MSTGIYSTIYEARTIRESEMTLGRREGVSLNLSGKSNVRKALSTLMTTVSSFLF